MLVKSAVNEGCNPRRQWVPCNKDSGDMELRGARAFEVGGWVNVLGGQWGARSSPSLPLGPRGYGMWKKKQPFLEREQRNCVLGRCQFVQEVQKRQWGNIVFVMTALSPQH